MLVYGIGWGCELNLGLKGFLEGPGMSMDNVLREYMKEAMIDELRRNWYKIGTIHNCRQKNHHLIHKLLQHMVDFQHI